MPVIVSFLYNSVLLATYLSNEGTFAEFSDLGNLLLGGFGLAVAVAIALTFVRAAA